MSNHAKKGVVRLERRRKAFDSLKDKGGYKRPGSTNPRKQG